MRGSHYIKKAFYMARRCFKRGAAILLYHRVIRLTDDPYWLAVSPEHFKQQMAYLQQTCTPMRLHDLVEALRTRSVPKRAVVVTFDDGYADNYLEACPILEATQVPATVFVATDHVDTDREYWWDDLERLLAKPAPSGEPLRVTVNGQTHEWDSVSAAHLARVRRTVFDLVHALRPAGREDVLAQLARWSGLGLSGRAEHRAVTTAELVALADSPYIDIGAHTQTHPQLSALSAAAQRTEIAGGRATLEATIKRPVQLFAYPYGTTQDFNADSVAVVRELGFDAAVTTTHGSVEAGDDLFLLRRSAVYDCSLDQFKRRLDTFFIERG